jgi:hypothetical protein
MITRKHANLMREGDKQRGEARMEKIEEDQPTKNKKFMVN